jgi:hypothetical protein
VYDDPADIDAAVEFSQEDQQVISNGARNTPVRQLQSILGGSQFAVPQRDDCPPHHMAVESVLDDQRSRSAQ